MLRVVEGRDGSVLGNIENDWRFFFDPALVKLGIWYIKRDPTANRNGSIQTKKKKSNIGKLCKSFSIV